MGARVSRILIVDDESSISWGLSRLARGMGHVADVAASAEEGLELAAVAAPDVLILDVRLPGMDGLTAVEAVRKGAFEYVVKPFDLAEIRAAIERALRVLPGGAKVAATETLDGMLG